MSETLLHSHRVTARCGFPSVVYATEYHGCFVTYA